jgi:hypothetical protein
LGVNGSAKVRFDINVTAETSHLLNEIIKFEQQDDEKNDRPLRSKSQILEMVVKKGIKVWQNPECARCLKGSEALYAK